MNVLDREALDKAVDEFFDMTEEEYQYHEEMHRKDWLTRKAINEAINEMDIDEQDLVIVPYEPLPRNREEDRAQTKRRNDWMRSIGRHPEQLFPGLRERMKNAKPNKGDHFLTWVDDD